MPHERSILLVKCDFSYSCAAADKISTDLRALTVSLRQLSYLSSLLFCFFGSVRQIKLAIRQLLDARKYNVYRTRIVLQCTVNNNISKNCCPCNGRLGNRCGHYNFVMLSLLSSFFIIFSSPNLSRRRLHVYHTSTHDVVLVRI